ncbi:hypothetical protein [Limnoraphis robusta]|uniref:Type II secretion system protein GspC N-terminal domain-containing protein n=1 Tax=Limnoraphis robusta CCNP1315 TaxID=3110306 RepID=A0ABU5TW31_9CYAN|nr:hypothetical protein [Limnoraphis robusta]MEA5496977.1 hypothetical protein [Limnoraphis robusta BA-68 BA1]MEA5519101.1 hypothetical protein [Limnoraphis robusta CCNP1315]MEA5548834.1 hypothetical protein [Limnoraphis robusta CCNP1324]
MPQETTTMNQTTQTLSEEQLIRDPASIEIYADRLMDDIFDDVERVLDGGAKLPKDPVEPEFISLKSIKVPQIILPPLARRDGEDGAIDTEVKLRDASAGKDQSFDRILLGTAFASLLITLSLWVATRGGINRLFAPAPVAVPADKPLSAKTQADIKFADYIERSLVAIEQDAPQTIPLLPPFPGTPPVENVAPIPVPNTNTPLGADTNNLIAAINRMADSIQDASNRTASLSNQVMQTLQQQAQQQQQPTPQAQQPVQTPTPGGQTSGSVSAPATQTAQASPTPAKPQATQQPTATPQPQPQAQPQPQPEPQAEQQPATASVSIPTPATAPAPAPEPAPETAPEPAPAPTAEEQPSETAAATTNPTQGSIHTLVGILELGDRSAALFEVNGVARRVYVGESIAASGWTLVEVVNQEAVIRRNGEVLTIYVGQQF